MKKRISSLLLALAMALVLLPMGAVAEGEDEPRGTPYAVTGGNIYYSISEDGDEAGITDCDPEVTEAIIPSSINGVPVVAIGMDAFGECEKLINVSIPNSVTSIEMGAFLGCTGLTDIKIPDSVDFIGSWAFNGCSGLASITLPDKASFGEGTFMGCTGVQYFSVSENHEYFSTIDGVLFSKDGTILEYYPAGNPRETYTIPDGVTIIDAIGASGGSFSDCNNLKSVIVPDSVTEINFNAFRDAKGLTNITLPDSISSIGFYAFSGCDRLRDIYYAGSEAQWKQIEIEEENSELTSATIHYNSTGPDQGTSTTPSTTPGTTPNTTSSEGTNDYIYDTTDPGESVQLPTEALDNVTDPSSAAAAVKRMTDGMTAEQKSSPTGIDLATLYAETAVSRAASKSMNSGDISINAAEVASLTMEAAQAVTAVETALSNGGITTARYLSKVVTYTTNETNISIQVNPDILTAQVDKLRVETPSYALTLSVGELRDDLTEPLTFKAQEVTSNYALKNNNTKATVKIDLPKAQMTNPVIVSLPKSGSDVTFQAMVKSDGTATSSKFNPATLTMDGRVNTSGTYTVKTNEKNFTDISGKSAEMQKAILYLTSKGIINGTSDTQFSPDNSINRQQIAALIMRALGKVDNTATTTFTDVPTSSSLYHAIASSQRHGIINGYSDNTFRGANVISKNQIVTVSGRVLTSEMNYKAPANMNTYLGKYSDSVPEYAQEMVALATREGLVVYRTDGTFSGDKNMTRGDAAIILYRLFQKIW